MMLVFLLTTAFAPGTVLVTCPTVHVELCTVSGFGATWRLRWWSEAVAASTVWPTTFGTFTVWSRLVR